MGLWGRKVKDVVQGHWARASSPSSASLSYGDNRGLFLQAVVKVKVIDCINA